MLKQVDKKGDEEEENGHQKTKSSWFHREVDAFHPQEIFFIDIAQFIQSGGVHDEMDWMQIWCLLPCPATL